MTSPRPADLGPATPMAGLHDSRFHELTSRSNGEAYRVFVGAPIAMQAGQTYPAIYVLDGKLNFAMVHAQAQILAALGQMPPAYVIGIAYAGDESFFEKDGLRRHQDLTPNAGGELERVMKEMNGAGAITHGGAAAFLAFLREELRPALEAAYAIDPHDATILGNSLGGLFPSWVLFHAPDAFQRYVIVSPSWWWNDYEMWSWETRYAERHDDLRARVFVAAGGFETAEAHQAIAERAMKASTDEILAAMDKTAALGKANGWPRMAEITPDFAARLSSRNYPGLDLAVINLPDETHESIPGPAFSRGLRFVFGSWRPGCRPGQTVTDADRLNGAWWTEGSTSPSPDTAPSRPPR